MCYSVFWFISPFLYPKYKKKKKKKKKIPAYRPCFFSKETGELIGFLITSYHKTSGANLYIDYIALKSEWRGQGLGSLILRDLLAQCKKERRSVHLFPERPELHPWYKSLSFRETNKGFFNFHSYETRLRNLTL